MSFTKLGTATFGHYWIYIFDFHRNIWRKYNDSYVSEVTDEKEVFGDSNDSYNRPATPYYLVYVQEPIKHELIDPVLRDIRTEPLSERQHEEYSQWDNGNTKDGDEMVVEMQERGDDDRGGGDEGIGESAGEKIFWYSGTATAGESPLTNYYVDDDNTQKFNADGW